MKASVTRRWSDTFWTLVRFSCCLGTTFGFAMLFYSTFPDPSAELRRLGFLDAETDPYMMQLRGMLELLFLMPIAMGMLIFSGWQLGARSPFHNPRMMHWLGIHGWDGNELHLPFRRAVPVAEMLCVAAVTVLSGFVSRTGFVLIPWAWLASRTILQTPRFLSTGLSAGTSSPHQPWPEQRRLADNRPMRWLTSISTEWKVGLLWSLTATVLLWLEQLWISVPVMLLATGLLHHLTLESFQRLSNDLMFTDLPASGPEISSFLAASRSRVSSLCPFYQLRPEVTDNRPGWGRAIATASVTAWITFCIATAIPNLFPVDLADVEQMEKGRTLAMLICGLIPVTCGLVRVILCVSPCWASRLGPISRILTRRLVVPSYDRVFKPLLLAVVIGCGTLMIPTDSWNVPLAVSVFLSMLLILRGSPAVDQWQMTADARLSTALMSNSKPVRR